MKMCRNRYLSLVVGWVLMSLNVKKKKVVKVLDILFHSYLFTYVLC